MTQQPRHGRFDVAELEELKARHSLRETFERFGVKFKKAGREWQALSPFNIEKSPSFFVNEDKRFFNDFSSGKNGDIFDAIMELKGCDFVEAVKMLGGTRPLNPEERREMEERSRQREEQEEQRRVQTVESIERIWKTTRPLAGTHGAAYLEARGLTAFASWKDDVRFVAAFDYRGMPAEDAEAEILGQFPAMVAAIRDVNGGIIGLHRTYLDPIKPVKLVPPGDSKRNKAKKVLGETSGGMIRLSPMGLRLAVGEGIETTASYFVLGMGGESDLAFASAVSLGNLAGRSMGTVPHPHRKMANGRPMPLPNGVPDLQAPGIILPPEVEELLILGDGDSDEYMTRARLLVAAERFKAQRVRVFFHRAPAGQDWSDVLTDMKKSEMDQAA